MNAMSKAHQIRKQAAKKHNCKVSEIYLGDCLRMAHHNEEIEAVVEKSTVQLLEEAATFSCFDKYEIEAGRKIELEIVTVQGKWTVYKVAGKESLTQGDCNRLKSNTARISKKPAFANLRRKQIGFMNS